MSTLNNQYLENNMYHEGKGENGSLSWHIASNKRPPSGYYSLPPAPLHHAETRNRGVRHSKIIEICNSFNIL